MGLLINIFIKHKNKIKENYVYLYKNLNNTEEKKLSF